MSDKKNKKKRSWADLAPRLLSALVLLPLTALILNLGGFWFAILVGLVFAGAFREWEIMVSIKKTSKQGMILIALVALSAVVFPIYGTLGTLAVILLAIALVLFLPSKSQKTNTRIWRSSGLLFFGIVIVAILSMRGLENLGIVAGVFLATCVWMTDTGAFFTGRLLGGAKLSPDISPSKTWSGAIGGLIVGTLSGLIVWIVATDSPIWIGVLLGASLSLSGQIGDLIESAIKRRFKVKDSSDLIPGHGGIMDRLDSLSLAVLILFTIGAVHSGNIQNIAQGFLIW
jgi:phosphatidate cytidylyltransferase